MMPWMENSTPDLKCSQNTGVQQISHYVCATIPKSEKSKTLLLPSILNKRYSACRSLPGQLIRPLFRQDMVRMPYWILRRNFLALIPCLAWERKLFLTTLHRWGPHMVKDSLPKSTSYSPLIGSILWPMLKSVTHPSSLYVRGGADNVGRISSTHL